MDLAYILSLELWNNSVQDYLIALAVLLASLFILRIFKFLVLSKLKRIKGKRLKKISMVIDVIDSFGWPAYIMLSLFISLRFINTTDLVNKIAYYVLLIIITFYAVKAIKKILNYAADKIIEKKKKEDKEVNESIIKMLTNIVMGVVWVLAAILILDNLGYNVTTLLAGLGIGGIAIAFALQGILSDLFASFSIQLDKPFKEGDFIIIGNDLGTVKKIGIKSTKIQALGGQELIVSNKELTSTRVNNYKRMERRRIVFTFGVTYDTSSSKMEKIPGMIRQIIGRFKEATIDRVHWKSFGDFSLNFEVVYFVESPDYNLYMDLQHKINLAIKKRFEKEKIEMAFPTQTIHVSRIK